MHPKQLVIALAVLATLAGHAAARTRPNFILIVPDDHRWDATGFMQQRMAALGRVARYPWFVSQTPGMDRLSSEGVHFDNAFVTYSLCSPSRATMLTGRHNHLNGIIDNQTHFPTDSVTYATLLRDAGYATGYFGKWHMADQLDRPGFTHVATFRNQGNYFGNTFYVNGAQVYEDRWVDDVSTDYLLEFIGTQAGAGTPFLAFLGFKTPHDPRIPPAAYSDLYSGVSLVDVPNMPLDPPFRPGADAGTGIGDNRNYFECLKGIDDNVVRLLDKLDTLGIAGDTVVIYISDNGYFQGEHGLGDKRAGYEESMRVPFMIRYPGLQNGHRTPGEIVLNLDIAPTILDLAGLPVPDSMQGSSLKPLIAGGSPAGWRTSFLYSYNRDPAYPSAIPSYVAIRTVEGDKLIHYPYSQDWIEIFDTSGDPYELDNLAGSPAHAALRERLYAELTRLAAEAGFLRMEGVSMGPANPRMDVVAGKGYNYQVESSAGLMLWQLSTQFKGTGAAKRIDLVPGATSLSDMTVAGDLSDYALTESPVSAVSGSSGTLRVGANTIDPAGGRNVVLVFSLPVIPVGADIEVAQLQVTGYKISGVAFNGDLWALGIKGDTTQVLRYLEAPEGDAASVKLQAGFLDPSVGSSWTTVVSSPDSGLTPYLKDFYQANPGYAGGQYLFLRVNPDADAGVSNDCYTLFSADFSTASMRPKLLFSLEAGGAVTGSAAQFYRVKFADPGTP